MRGFNRLRLMPGLAFALPALSVFVVLALQIYLLIRGNCAFVRWPLRSERVAASDPGARLPRIGISTRRHLRA